MSSSRLPGKSLIDLRGRPLVAYLLECLQHTRRADAIIVATSSDPSDDPLAAYCESAGVAVSRGPLEDVAARFGLVVEQHGLDAFVRISGDSPLLDHRLVDHAVERYNAHLPAIATNIVPRTYPHGQSVEVVDAQAFGTALAEMTDTADREHVTPFLYRDRDRFPIDSIVAPADWHEVRLAVDTPEDVARIGAMIDAMDRPHWQYSCSELVEMAEAMP